MPLRWISPPAAPDAPQIALAAPGSVGPAAVTGRQRLTTALAAGSLLAVGLRPPVGPLPRPLSSPFNVTNLLDTGGGSLRQAIDDANANPGPDTVTFQSGLTGTITLVTQLSISDTVDIQGPGPGLLSVSGDHVTRVFYIGSPLVFTTTISGLTIRDGSVTKFSGGIRDKGEYLVLDHVAVLSNTTVNGRGGGVEVTTGGPNQGGLTVRNSLISGNHATRGGGLFTDETPGAVLIQNTQFVSNTAAVTDGGGAFLYRAAGDITIEDAAFTDNYAAQAGGGLSIYNTTGGQHVIRRTTLSGNIAANAAGLLLYEIYDPLLLEDLTVSGNHAAASGGGMQLYGAVTLRNSTIVSNTAVVQGGGLTMDGGFVPINDTIIANNTAPLNPDLDGGLFVLRYDLVQVTGTATLSDTGGNLFGLDPLLGPLANNGGPTQTHFPGAGSPAINAGDPAFAPPPSTDQRGDPRVTNGRVDIGAVELMAGVLQFNASTFQAAESVLTATITVTRTGGSEGAVAVNYATSGGTATPGSDYQPAAGALHWANGDAAPKTFTVTLVNDGLVESSETVGLTLSNAQGGALLGVPLTATLTILDSGARLFLPVVQR